MDITPQSIAFYHDHLNDDPTSLLLQSRRYPEVHMRWVAQQIEGHRQALVKYPSWAACQEVMFPPRINREQSSSEHTARYKASLVEQGSVLDLTGGMGVDSWAFWLQGCEVTYLESNAELFPYSHYNLSVLTNSQISCYQTDCMKWLTDSPLHFSTIYIDPARRDSAGSRVAAFEDCTPNLLDSLPLIMSKCRQLLVKASPMIDIQTALQQLQSVSQVHVVSVKGECKEVLFLCQREATLTQFHCVDLRDHTVQSHNQFTLQSEAESTVTFCSSVGRYLYMPHAALLKGGCFRSICGWYHVEKLGRNTHLYTSDTLIESFPGRSFEVVQEVSPNAKELRPLIPEGACHVIARNYPLTADQLLKKLKMREGGSMFVIATKLGDKPLCLLCRKVHHA